MNFDLSIIIVNYNGGRWLQDGLRSVFHRVNGLSFEVLVVDNHSFDGSLEGIEQKFPQVRLLRNEQNLGFAKASNLGIKAARGRYKLLLNPDTTVLNQAFGDWIRYMDAHPQVGISGPKVYDDENRQSVQLSCRSFPSLMNYFFNRYSLLNRLFPHNRFSQRYLMSASSHDDIHAADWVSGCCMLLRPEMLADVGLLDEGYALFSEDVDICYRAQQGGWQVVYFPGVEIAHHTGSLRAQATYRTIVQRHLSLWRFCTKFYRGSPPFRVIVSLGVWARMGLLLGMTALKQALPYALDVILIQASTATAFGLRHLWTFPWTQRAVQSYLDVALWYTLVQVFLLYVFELYRRAAPRFDDYLDVLPQVIKAVSLGTLMLVFTAFFNRQFVLPRSIIVLSWLFNVLLLTGWRWVALHHRQKHLQLKRVLIYGTGPLAALVGAELQRRLALRYRPIGFVRPRLERALAVDRFRVLGTPDDLEKLVGEHRVDEVLFAAEDRSDEEINALMDHCAPAHLNTRVAPDLFESALGNTHLKHFQVPFMDPEIRSHHGYIQVKRALDLVLGGGLLVGVLPLMALIALKLKSALGGPVLSKQPRAGFQGKAFTLYKFRKARTAQAEEDPFRMAPFGRFLRRTRLDELPQLFNVIRGEMSLVGPQPERLDLARTLEREVPSFAHRYRLRPGMTGWAQVELKYANSTKQYREKLQYDLYYLKNMSLALDFKILLKSMWVVITGRGVV